MNLDVKEILSDLTQMEKSLATSYCQAELESANKSLRNSHGNMQRKVQENHAKLFNEMHQRGWYKTPTAGQQAIESTIISWEQKFVKEPILNPKGKH
jgi:spore coat protein CotF